MGIDLLVYFSFIHSFVLRSLKLHFPVSRVRCRESCGTNYNEGDRLQLNDNDATGAISENTHDSYRVILLYLRRLNAPPTFHVNEVFNLA